MLLTQIEGDLVHGLLLVVGVLDVAEELAPIPLGFRVHNLDYGTTNLQYELYQKFKLQNGASPGSQEQTNQTRSGLKKSPKK